MNVKYIYVVVLAVKAASGSLAESTKLNNSTVDQIQRTAISSARTTDTLARAAESLQVQRRAFLASIILSYLTRPEDNPPEVLENETKTNNDLQTTAGQSTSWSHFADSSIHLRVLRSTSEPEARALFFRRRASMPSPTTHPPRRHQLATRPSSVVGRPVQPVAEFTGLLDDLYERRRTQFINGEAEETSATIEVVQTRTPFVMTNGQMIMNDLPMVF